jgi:hypothetical protein
VYGFDTDEAAFVLLDLWSEALGGSDDPARNAGALQSYLLFSLKDAGQGPTNITMINVTMQLPLAIQAALASKQITDLSNHDPLYLPSFDFLPDSEIGASSEMRAGLTLPTLNTIIIDAATGQTAERWTFTMEYRRGGGLNFGIGNYRGFTNFLHTLVG